MTLTAKLGPLDRNRRIFTVTISFLVSSLIGSQGQLTTTNFFNWETVPVHPIDLSPDRSRLAVCNLPDNRLELFDVTTDRPVPLKDIPVGLDPVAVRFRN